MKRAWLTRNFLKLFMLIGAVLTLLGAYMLVVNAGVPLPTFNIEFAGGAMSGSDVPPGLVLLVAGGALGLGAAWLSNDRMSRK